MRKKDKKFMVMDSLRTQIRNIVVFNLHWKLLKSNKKYFKLYCQSTGISEYEMRRVMNKTYNGKLPKLIVMVRKAGLVVDITFEKKYK